MSAGARDPDAALLRRYAAGDPAAAGALTGRLAPRAYGVALRVLGDAAEAEDIAQEAMLRLWRAAPGWSEGDALVSTWLYRVTLNLCIDTRRRRARAVVGLDGLAEPVDDRPGPAEALQQGSRAQALQAALLALPPRQRQAVVLRHLEGLSNPRIAEIMDISAEAVESLTARGKRGLAAALGARRAELGFGDDRA